VLLLERRTTYPAVGAAAEIVTVPVEEVPPLTEVGLSTNAVTVGALIVREAALETELNVPVMVVEVLGATGVVETVNVPLVAPEGIVTVLGTVADAELLVSETVRPLLGAAEPIVAVPVEELPPVTDVGATVIDAKTGGAIVRISLAEVLFALAVIVADVLLGTGAVVTANVAVVAPDATVTELGTVAKLLLLERLTTKPEPGATEEIVTTPVEVAPPVSDVGLNASDETFGLEIVRVAVALVLPVVAVIVALVVLVTEVVETVKFAVVEPDATVTELGTVADELLLERLTE
jgi:hypothetical protein